MKTFRVLARGIFIAVIAVTSWAAERVTITVTHEFAAARPSETITVPWSELARSLPGAQLQQIAVKDEAGRSLAYQVTNVAPEAKDPGHQGLAYGDLIFQHDFAAGERSATFTVEKITGVAPVFPAKVFARYVPERLDDFAWENDKVAHRTYGPALAAPATPGSDKEVLVTSGVDIWSKRVSYPIVDRWYNKGGDHYHRDEGEGMDMYHVGVSRGCGGTGIWDGKKLYVGRNYKTWKVLANGPIRAVFELTYDAWDAAGLKVTETKRFTVDAGHNFDQVESTFTAVEQPAAELMVAIGLNKTPVDDDQEGKIELTPVAADGSLTQWIVQKTNGALGTAIIVPKKSCQGFAEDERNQLILVKAVSGRALRYWVGAGWSKAENFSTAAEWNATVAAWATRMRAPLKVTVSPSP